MNIDGYEIERKYLIEMPEHSALIGLESSEIKQTYLLPKNAYDTERVRMRKCNDIVGYTHTIKRRVSDIVRKEDEREICLEEYNALLKRIDASRKSILKTRYCLNYDQQLFEIDIYPFWDDVAIMEIELNDENMEVILPPFIKLIKEVTDDSRFTNASLAREIPEININEYKTEDI